MQLGHRCRSQELSSRSSTTFLKIQFVILTAIPWMRSPRSYIDCAILDAILNALEAESDARETPISYQA